MSGLHALPAYQALLAAVRAEPDADLPRLVFADWLDDRGDTARADLIRTQLELAAVRDRRDALGRRVGYRDIRRVRPLTRREDELLSAGWTPPVPGIGMYVTVAPYRLPEEHLRPAMRYARGFVDAVSWPADLWELWGDELLLREPVRTARLTTSAPSDGPTRTPLAGRWPGVTFSFPTEPG